MKLLKWLGIVIAVLVLIVAVVGLSLPRRFEVVRDITVDAPPEAIYPVVAQLREWPTWTAWTVERYPDMKVSFSGPEEGIGAKQSWAGKSSGSGSIEITKADPQGGIDYDFEREGNRSTGGIIYFPIPDGTIVAWHAEGDLGFNPINRYFGLFMGKMMAPDFETGLRNLKARVEKAANKGVLPQVQDSPPPTTAPAQEPESR